MESERQAESKKDSSNNLPLFSHIHSKKENLPDKLSDQESGIGNLQQIDKSMEEAFEKNLEGLENLVKLFKSDVNKMFDISDSSFPSSSIHASPEK